MNTADLDWQDQHAGRRAPVAVAPCPDCEGVGERENRFGRMDACDACDGTGRENAAQATPGPWQFNRGVEGYGTVSADALGLRIAIVCGPNSANANGLLIAAAPDLLAGVKLWASECGDCNGTGLKREWDGRGFNEAPCEACSDIRALIAKATQP